MNAAWLRRILLVVLAIALLAWVSQSLEAAGAIRSCVEYFRAAGPVPFFLAMALIPVAGVPMSAFTLTAGGVFGPTLGVGPVIACALVAQTCNMALCYGLATRWLRPWLERWMARRGWMVPTWAPGAAWEIVLLVRIVNVTPLFVQSYALGLARVPFAPYLVVSVLTRAVFVSGTVLLGSAWMSGDWRVLAIGALLLGAGALAIYRLRRWLTARRPDKKTPVVGER